MLFNILVASTTGSLLALIGGIVLLWREKFAKKISLVLVSFATGSLLGAAFLDLLPEALENTPYESISLMLIAGLIFMFLFEKAIKHYHHHEHETHSEEVGFTVLFGDSIHNFIDGITIALAFSVSTHIGFATTIAIFFHEVPQEIGDFGVLLHKGFSRGRIIWLNVVTALTTFVGALLGYILLPWISGWLHWLIAFAAGTFIYIAVSDLMPELKERTGWKGVFHVLTIILGVAMVWALGAYLPE